MLVGGLALVCGAGCDEQPGDEAELRTFDDADDPAGEIPDDQAEEEFEEAVLEPTDAVLPDDLTCEATEELGALSCSDLPLCFYENRTVVPKTFHVQFCKRFHGKCTCPAITPWTNVGNLCWLADLCGLDAAEPVE